MRNRVLRMFAAFCMAAMLLPFCAFADNTAAAPRTVRVGYFLLDGFQEYDSANQAYTGYGYEYLLAVAQHAGWQLVLVPVTYESGLQMLRDGELDIVNMVEEDMAVRESLAVSANSTGESCTYLVVSQDDTATAYEDFDKISRFRVGLRRDDWHNGEFLDYCAVHGATPNVTYYDGMDAVSTAMASDEVDAYLCNSMQPHIGRVVGQFATKPYYFAVRGGNTALLSELDQAMNDLRTADPNFDEKIHEKYYNKSGTTGFVLSESEKEYLVQNPVVTVAYDPKWYPISYRDSDGNFAGVISELYGQISEVTGLKFEFVATDTFTNALSAFTEGKMQVMAEMPYDYVWATRHHARLTAPYTTITVVGAFGKSPAASGGPVTIAVPPGYYQQFLMQNIREDNYAFTNFDSIEECLQAVLDGRADYAMLNSYQFEYYRTRAKYKGMSSKVLDGADYELSAAVSDAADPRLLSIMSKALQSIGTSRISDIFLTASSTQAERSLSDLVSEYPMPTIIIVSVFTALLAVIISMRRYSVILRRKNDQLHAATNAKAAFFSNISHDMRTPLNGIIGFTDLAMSEDSLDAMKADVSNIRTSGIFLQKLINDTLDLSKSENKMLKLAAEPVNLRLLLEETTIISGRQAETGGVRLKAELPPEPGEWVLADKLRLQQIVINVLSNAIKFTPSGGAVTLVVAKNPGGDWHISVQDTGCGISREFLPHIFEAFAQEQNTGNRPLGTGLGLSIVKHLVDLMGGKIEVHSAVGEGTRFDIDLPLPPAPAQQPAAAMEQKATGSLEGRRILLCEDNAINRELAARLLENRGMLVTCAEDGKEGAAVFQGAPEGYFDLVLMDIRMPVMNGFEAARAIRALPRGDASTPIIAMTADAFDDAVQECYKAGMNGHIAKPIDPEKLYSMLLDHIGQEERV